MPAWACRKSRPSDTLLVFWLPPNPSMSKTVHEIMSTLNKFTVHWPSLVIRNQKKFPCWKQLNCSWCKNQIAHIRMIVLVSSPLHVLRVHSRLWFHAVSNYSVWHEECSSSTTWRSWVPISSWFFFPPKKKFTYLRKSVPGTLNSPTKNKKKLLKVQLTCTLYTLTMFIHLSLYWQTAAFKLGYCSIHKMGNLVPWDWVHKSKVKLCFQLNGGQPWKEFWLVTEFDSSSTLTGNFLLH